MVVHRWQPTGLTPCGLRTDAVRTNTGRVGDAGVTCKRCRVAGERVSLWAGEAHPDVAPRQLRLEE